MIESLSDLLLLSTSASLLEGHTVGECWSEFCAKFPTIYAFDWLIWPPSQYINFRYLCREKFKIKEVVFHRNFVPYSSTTIKIVQQNPSNPTVSLLWFMFMLYV
jgi:hypothetical protein